MATDDIIPTPAEEAELMGWLSKHLPRGMAGEVMAVAAEQIHADRRKAARGA